MRRPTEDKALDRADKKKIPTNLAGSGISGKKNTTENSQKVKDTGGVV
jgi:hypothetical protein